MDPRCELRCELPRELLLAMEGGFVDLSSRSLGFFAFGSGRPSHLLFTLGTLGGSFCDETACNPTVLVLPPFVAAFCLSWRAYSSHAVVEGSFSARNPNTLLFGFFVLLCMGENLGSSVASCLVAR